MLWLWNEWCGKAWIDALRALGGEVMYACHGQLQHSLSLTCRTATKIIIHRTSFNVLMKLCVTSPFLSVKGSYARLGAFHPGAFAQIARVDFGA